MLIMHALKPQLIFVHKASFKTRKRFDFNNKRKNSKLYYR